MSKNTKIIIAVLLVITAIFAFYSMRNKNKTTNTEMVVEQHTHDENCEKNGTCGEKGKEKIEVKKEEKVADQKSTEKTVEKTKPEVKKTKIKASVKKK